MPQAFGRLGASLSWLSWVALVVAALAAAAALLSRWAINAESLGAAAALALAPLVAFTLLG